MYESPKCRHGKPHSENCDACAAEYRRLDKWRADIKLSQDALVAKALALGRNQTSIIDGTEVTATPSGHVFYNAADWW